MTAASEVDLQKQLGILRDFIIERHLEINFKKEEIIMMGPGTGLDKKWTLLKQDGEYRRDKLL